MKISPVSFTRHNQNQGFKGITNFAYKDCYDDHTQEVSVNVDHYEYYPFKDESQMEIKKTTYPLDRTKYESGSSTSYGSLYGDKTTIMPRLHITKAQYEALKSKGVDDDFIIKTFK